MNDMVLDVFTGAAKEMNYPLEGRFAFNLWLLCNKLPVEDGKKVLKACGYEAFKGYPLTRLSNKVAA